MSPTRRGTLAAPHVAAGGEAVPTANVPALPSGVFQACVFFFHDTPDELAEVFVKLIVEPDDADGSPAGVATAPHAELNEAQRRDFTSEYRRVIDPATKPATYQAAATLIAALLAAGETELVGDKS
jgi:hypothetical protein